MRPQEVSLDADGNSDPIFPDLQQSAIAIGIQVTFDGSADGNATVQATLRNPKDSTFDATVDWIDVTDFAGIMASQQGNIIAPVYALRLQRASAGAGIVFLTVLQGRTN